MTAAECQLNIFGSHAEFEKYMREQSAPPAEGAEPGAPA
jgi:hypothetical protein